MCTERKGILVKEKLHAQTFLILGDAQKNKKTGAEESNNKKLTGRQKVSIFGKGNQLFLRLINLI